MATNTPNFSPETLQDYNGYLKEINPLIAEMAGLTLGHNQAFGENAGPHACVVLAGTNDFEANELSFCMMVQGESLNILGVIINAMGENEGFKNLILLAAAAHLDK